MVQLGNNLPLRTKIILFGLSGLILLSIGFIIFLNSAIQKTDQTLLEERLALAVVISSQIDVNIHLLELIFLQGVESRIERSSPSNSINIPISELEKLHDQLITAVNQVVWINHQDKKLVSYPPDLISTIQFNESELANRVTLHPASQIFLIHLQNPSSSYIGVPILDSNEQELGVILAEISSQKIFNSVQNDLLLNRSDIVIDIVSSGGVIVQSTKPDRYLKVLKVPENIAELIKGGNSAIEVCSDCQNRTQGDFIEIQKAVISPLTHASWGVIISESHQNPIEKFQSPLGKLLIYGLVVLILILLLATFLSASLLTPIGELSYHISRIANRNFNDQINFARRDELGLLAQSIDAMRSNIKQDVDEIAAINVGLDADVAKAQLEISELSSDFQVVIDSLTDDLVIVDQNFRIQQANASVRTKHGGQKDVVGQLCWEINHAEIPCIDTNCECPVQHVFNTGLPSRVIHVHQNTNKKDRYVEVIASPVKNTHGNIRGVVELIRDISEERWKDDQRKKLIRKVVCAQEDERQRIARDLHDEIGQSITAIIMRCGALEQSVKENQELLSSLSTIRVTASATMQNLRSIMLDLQPDLLDELGLSMAIRALINDRLTPVGIECQLEINGLKTRLPHLIEITTYRVIQEAITNILKHSKATQAMITLNLNSETLNISITDNGLGFDQSQNCYPKDTNGLGLRSMIERIGVLNGDLEIETSHDAGTHIIANIPLETQDEPN